MTFAGLHTMSSPQAALTTSVRANLQPSDLHAVQIRNPGIDEGLATITMNRNYGVHQFAAVRDTLIVLIKST